VPKVKVASEHLFQPAKTGLETRDPNVPGKRGIEPMIHVDNVHAPPATCTGTAVGSAEAQPSFRSPEFAPAPLGQPKA
jgi:hypothetical protein